MAPEIQTAALTHHEPRWLGRLDWLWLELTPRCNLRCSHCYAEAGPALARDAAMSYDNWINVLRQAFDLGCRSVQFTGGEPTLCPELPRLLSAAREIGFECVEVYTNGTNLNQNLRDALVKERVDLAFSVYGSQADVHDAVTRRPGSFAKTIESIRWALNAGLAVRAGVIEMPSNSADIRGATALLRRLGVRTIGVDGVRRVGRGNGRVSANRRGSLDELCGDCWRGKLAIDSAGNAFPCVFARFCRVGHVSQSLASILRSEQLHDFRKEVRKMAKATKKSSAKKRGPTSKKKAGTRQGCTPKPRKGGCTPKPRGGCTPKRPKTGCTPKKGGCTPKKEIPCTPKMMPCTPKGACEPSGVPKPPTPDQQTS